MPKCTYITTKKCKTRKK